MKQINWIWSGRIPSLDGLRAVSIACVLVAHLAHYKDSVVPSRLSFLGEVGVDMFFVISGFLITLLMLREDKKTGRISIKQFYLRRALRILPAYCALLFVLFIGSSKGLISIPERGWPALLTYTVNFIPSNWTIGHIWSLSVEEHFYLLWPILLGTLGPRPTVWLAAAYIVVTPVIRCFLWWLDSPYLNLAYCTPARADSIAMGCCLAFLAVSRRFAVLTNRLKMHNPAILVLAIAGLLGSKLWLHHLGILHILFSTSINGLALSLALWVCILQEGTPIGRLLNSKPLVIIGVLSYSVYLWQQLFFNPYSGHWACRWPINLLIVGMCATASFFLIESPFLRWKGSLATQASRKKMHPERVLEDVAV